MEVFIEDGVPWLQGLAEEAKARGAIVVDSAPAAESRFGYEKVRGKEVVVAGAYIDFCIQTLVLNLLQNYKAGRVEVDLTRCVANETDTPDNPWTIPERRALLEEWLKEKYRDKRLKVIP